MDAAGSAEVFQGIQAIGVPAFLQRRFGDSGGFPRPAAGHGRIWRTTAVHPLDAGWAIVVQARQYQPARR
jgi:hypothetical protein